MNQQAETLSAGESGVTDVRRVRTAIASQHGGDLAAHVAESNRIAEALQAELGLGQTVLPPARRDLPREELASRAG